ncbi:MAG: OmpA family protein [Clostridia bacterium]|nr:OmpA family protein [Clostridia bacterium]
MKINVKQIMAIILAIAILASLSACGKKDLNNNEINGTFNEFLVAEKIGTVNRDDFTTNEGGLTYQGENGLYGIMSYEGLRDTGAIYAKVTSVDKYFLVRKTLPSSGNDLAGVNSAALVDNRGNTIVPTGYATFDVINERYVVAYSVTERTYLQDDAMVSYSTDTNLCFSSTLTGDDTCWYLANWCVYDIKTGTPVVGASGSNDTLVSARGEYISFTNAEDNRICINSKGESLPEGAYLFDDGSYKIESKLGEVYATDGTKLFSYDLTGYEPYYIYGDYYVATKYQDGESTSAIMNKKGEILSEGYTDIPTIYGEIVHSDDKIYNLNGDIVIEGTYTSVDDDRVFGNNWMLHNNSYYTLIDKDGNVFYNGGGNKTHVWESDFVASTEKDDDRYYFSHKDQDYTIKGYHFAPWIVEVPNANSMYDLVDTMTGETLLAGYKDYSSISYNSFAYYVYAKYNGGADVYLIVSGSQLSEVTEKKSRLYDDLISAFAAEGITVSVNKETGEIALDSSVLFGGDSAELTADGKTFLNKFIKAYTTVVYSEEYTGFISKTMVEGHTAPVAGSTYASGYDLSVERATNVKNYCLSGETGIDVTPIANTLEAVGYSNSQPIYDSNGDVNMAASRRVSFRFMVNIEF